MYRRLYLICLFALINPIQLDLIAAYNPMTMCHIQSYRFDCVHKALWVSFSSFFDCLRNAHTQFSSKYLHLADRKQQNHKQKLFPTISWSNAERKWGSKLKLGWKWWILYRIKSRTTLHILPYSSEAHKRHVLGSLNFETASKTHNNSGYCKWQPIANLFLCKGFPEFIIFLFCICGVVQWELRS